MVLEKPKGAFGFFICHQNYHFALPSFYVLFLSFSLFFFSHFYFSSWAFLLQCPSFLCHFPLFFLTIFFSFLQFLLFLLLSFTQSFFNLGRPTSTYTNPPWLTQMLFNLHRPSTPYLVLFSLPLYNSPRNNQPTFNSISFKTYCCYLYILLPKPYFSQLRIFQV